MVSYFRDPYWDQPMLDAIQDRAHSLSRRVFTAFAVGFITIPLFSNMYLGCSGLLP